MTVQIVYEIRDENGVSEKERNLQITHNIPLGTLVEVNYPCSPEHGCRLFVVEHTRDCDGEPLYSLSFDIESVKKTKDFQSEYDALKHMNENAQQPDSVYVELVKMCLYSARGSMTHGYSEEILTVIREA